MQAACLSACCQKQGHLSLQSHACSHGYIPNICHTALWMVQVPDTSQHGGGKIFAASAESLPEVSTAHLLTHSTTLRALNSQAVLHSATPYRGFAMIILATFAFLDTHCKSFRSMKVVINAASSLLLNCRWSGLVKGVLHGWERLVAR